MQIFFYQIHWIKWIFSLIFHFCLMDTSISGMLLINTNENKCIKQRTPKQLKSIKRTFQYKFHSLFVVHLAASSIVDLEFRLLDNVWFSSHYNKTDVWSQNIVTIAWSEAAQKILNRPSGVINQAGAVNNSFTSKISVCANVNILKGCHQPTYYK